MCPKTMYCKSNNFEAMAESSLPNNPSLELDLGKFFNSNPENPHALPPYYLYLHLDFIARVHMPNKVIHLCAYMHVIKKKHL